MLKKTKIVATIGPASEDASTLSQLYEAGVNVIRVNFSHGDYEEHGEKIERWQEIIAETNHGGAVMADLAGPEIRTGAIDEPLTFAVGDDITLTTKKDAAGLYVNYPDLPSDVSKEDEVLIDDGRLAFSVSSTTDTTIKGEITRGGTISTGGRGVNVPGVELSLPSLTEKDEADLAFALKKGVDFVAISFVKSADDVELMRKKLVEHDAEDTKIVAKIETQSAVNNLQEIVAATDCVMVARGDLAVEVRLENVPMIQKNIIRTCNSAGVTVITATQMLESMIDASTPTRAEASDVANAILDGSDAVMLSGETAMGEYPVETVSVMSRIASQIEMQRKGANRQEIEKHHHEPVDAITASVVRVAEDIHAKAIVALTDSGFTARMLSRYRPKQDIIAYSPFARTCRQLSLSYGCDPYFLKEAGNTGLAIKRVKELLLNRNDFTTGDKIVIAAGISASAEHLGTNSLLIAEL